MPLFAKKLNPSVKELEKGLLKFGLVALFFIFGIFGVFSDVLANGYEDDDFTRTGAWLPTGLKWNEFNYDSYGYLTLDLKWLTGYESNYPAFPVEPKLYFQNYYNASDKQGIKFRATSTEPSIYFYEYDCESEFKVTKPDYWGVSRSWCWITTTSSALKMSVKRLDYDGVMIYSAVGLTKTEIDAEYGTNFLENKKSWNSTMCWESTIEFGRVGYFDGWYQVTNVYHPLIFPFDLCRSNNCGECVSWYPCQNVGCCWYYSVWLRENFCVSCPTGECASSFYECQNCLTQGTCEAEENCYWFNGLCKFGLGECGEGFDCQFCNTSSTCATANCYWFDNFCWLGEPPEVTSWFDYYSEYGDYPTSSAFVNQMASTTAIVFGSIGSFLAGFVEAFDTSEALAQGSNFGSAIPKMRGYLAIFNNFFGELPVAQAFLFLISFLLAVGLFRLIRNLITLFKFW